MSCVWLNLTCLVMFCALMVCHVVQVLTAKVNEHDIALWKSVYLAGLSPMLHISQTDFGHELTQLGAGEEMSSPSADGLPRSK